MACALGVVLTRGRAAVTLMARGSSRSPPESANTLLQKPRTVSRLIPFSKADLDTEADFISNAIAKEYRDFIGPSECIGSDASVVGFLESPILNGDSRTSDIELLKLQAITSHELRRLFGQPAAPISLASIRNSIGSKGLSSKDHKRSLIELFMRSVNDRSECSTQLAKQIMAESWGAASVIYRQLVLDNFRSSFPDKLEKIREEVSRRKVFRDSKLAKKDVLDDILNSEVDKILHRRLGLIS
jgi:hypothetical protein